MPSVPPMQQESKQISWGASRASLLLAPLPHQPPPFFTNLHSSHQQCLSCRSMSDHLSMCWCVGQCRITASLTSGATLRVTLSCGVPPRTAVVACCNGWIVACLDAPIRSRIDVDGLSARPCYPCIRGHLFAATELRGLGGKRCGRHLTTLLHCDSVRVLPGYALLVTRW